MPIASLVRCKVLSKLWLTPTVLQLRFEPSRKFSFEPGQFLSVFVPVMDSRGRPLRRIYSMASPNDGVYELCIKQVHGPGTSYLCGLEVGDEFKASAPYGHFCYETEPTRSACFIATGTGVAPFRSMVLSRRFAENRPENALLLFGARSEEEIIYTDDFESRGVQVVNAISRPSYRFEGFQGRVTDYLRSLPVDWAWHSTDFYLCGNGEMVSEAVRLLRFGRGVPLSAIHQEVYFSTHAPATAYAEALSEKKAA
jgi:ferredoxin-NADP reductase